MANYNLLEVSNPEKLKSLKAMWEPKKEYIEKDLWVIRNFLTKAELKYLTDEANDPDNWYPTMRSPYGQNIRNKFLGYIPQYGEDGVLIPPHPDYDPQFMITETLIDIQDRMEAVLPKYFGGAGAFQSFFEVPDEQIIAELGHDVDYAMGFHYERDESDSEEVQKTIVVGKITEAKITASFNLYVNDNFDGGELMFKNKDYVIKPEPGMLVNVPLTKEFEHKVNKVTNGDRHALYGRCWDNLENSYLSSREDC
jgi:hypothetical protein